MRPPGRERPEADLALLIAITMTGTAALHIFVPALSAVTEDLDASPFAAQLTISLYLVGLAGGQLVYGPLSDSFGRRPVVIGSLALYLVGFLLAIPATSIDFLIAARVLQSLGGCGSLVIGRAMVRDVSSGATAAGRMALLVTAMTLTPAVAPALGGLVNGWLGWRAIFAMMALLVAILLALVILTLPETNRHLSPLPSPRRIVGAYAGLLRSDKFRSFLVAGMCGGTSLYAFLATAPFLLIDVLGRSAAEVGLYCLLVSLGMAVGSVLARQLAGRLEIRHAARRGNAISAAAAAALLVIDLTGNLNVATLVAPLFVYAVGIGVSGPNVVAGLMNIYPEQAGATSSIYGFSQMAAGAVFTLIVAIWHTYSGTPLAVTLILASVAAGVALHRV